MRKLFVTASNRISLVIVTITNVNGNSVLQVLKSKSTTFRMKH